MIRIAVCDDEKSIRKQVIDLIMQEKDRQNVNVEVIEFSTGENLLLSIENREKIDIIYLDIKMSETDGIETAKAIKRINPYIILMFVSGYEEQLYSAFEARPFGFIRKPIEQKHFSELFSEACLYLLRQDEEMLKFQYDKKFHVIPYSQIIYLESNRRKICIHTREGEYYFYEKLDNLQELLSHSKSVFLRIHQSYLVNMRHVLQVEYEQVTMVTGEVLSISKDKRKMVRRIYMEKRGNLWTY